MPMAVHFPARPGQLVVMVLAPLAHSLVGVTQAVVRPPVCRGGNCSGRSARADHPIVPCEGLRYFNANLEIYLAVQVQRQVSSGAWNLRRAHEVPHFAAGPGNDGRKLVESLTTSNHVGKL